MPRRSTRSNRKPSQRIFLNEVQEVAKRLSPEQQKYVRLRWGANQHLGFATTEAAARLGLTVQEALQIESNILEKLPWFSDPGLRPESVRDVVQPLAVLPITPEIVVVSGVVASQLVAEILKFPELLHRVHHRKFEELIAFFFDALGYEVELTKRTRDGGRDVVAVRNGEVAIRYLIECKHPAQGTPVGVQPVRELYAVKIDEGATKALLATNTYFTADARAFEERHPWELELKDYDAVLSWLRMIPDAMLASSDSLRHLLDDNSQKDS